jgi:hypothetical protein
MNLYEKPFAIYPDLKPEDFDLDKGSILLRNDGNANGDYIFEWNHPTLKKTNR